MRACPRGEMVRWQEPAPQHTSEEVEAWLAGPPRRTLVAFPKYTPEENPQEPTGKDLQEEVSHQHWHETFEALQPAIAGY